MNKKDFTEKMAERLNITKAEAARVTDAFLAELTLSFTESGGVNFLGFGKFEVKNRAGRKGKNPRTGEEVIIPPYKAAHFAPGKRLKEIVNK